MIPHLPTGPRYRNLEGLLWNAHNGGRYQSLTLGCFNRILDQKTPTIENTALSVSCYHRSLSSYTFNVPASCLPIREILSRSRPKILGLQLSIVLHLPAAHQPPSLPNLTAGELLRDTSARHLVRICTLTTTTMHTMKPCVALIAGNTFKYTRYCWTHLE